MKTFDLKGLGVALITPFKSDKSIDFKALGVLLDQLIEADADYIVVLGTTGETPALFPDEKKAIRDFVVNHVNGRIPLVLGLGGNNTLGIVKELKDTDLSGFSAILSVVPYYNKPSQEGIYRHYKAISEASPLPVVLYNVPGRTGVNMTPATTLKLAEECDNIIGVKEASGNLSQIQEIIKRRKDGFVVVSGDDSITYPLMALGVEGVISVLGNVFPKEFGEMVRLCLSGRHAEALPKHLKFHDLYSLLFVDGNPAGVKAALTEMGVIENELRLPLVPAREETIEQIRKILSEMKKS